ncbi:MULTISPECIES: hypothetical protein [Nostoc]|uniref:NAD/NADP transhydrogenase beta subunit n=1 Tax=Nostoc paludosum FACHB-159 TaxID=2692908 RepID=A0ABR8KNS9_9NOSO|nr:MULTISPECIES: hypothetical protein [Nostoc]MBD2683162.1 hypothetical protein [Nostoc sp. FACHB-857]MBD2739507.1 hypothetical protein [Nostoc paludosum FACHB-159]
MFLLAQLNNDLVNLAKENAASVAQGFNELWQETIAGGVYSAICDVGALFAVATLTFFVIEWTKKMMAGEEQRAYTDFIWPLIVISLLSNNGNLLGQSTLGIRNYINNVNNIVLTKAAAGIDLKKAYEQALGTEAARSAIGLVVNRCQNSSLSKQEQINCLYQAKKELTKKYPDKFSQNGLFSWFVDAIDGAVDAFNDVKDGKASGIDLIFSPINAFVGSAITDIITIILVGMNGAYQWGIELTMLVTALLGPVAVGSSLLPYGAKSIYTWLVGYFSVGFGKLCFNIIVGFAGQLVADSKTYQPMFFLFTIGVIAPFLATGLAAGGGVAVLTQINKAAETYSSIAIEVTKGLVTKGGSLVGKMAK